MMQSLYHTELVEKICELDDDLMMQYLEGEEPSIEQLKACIKKSYHVSVPLFRYAAVLLTETKVFRNCLDAVVEFMPAPTDIPSIKGVDLDGNEVLRHSSDEEPFSALAFNDHDRPVRW